MGCARSSGGLCIVTWHRNPSCADSRLEQSPRLPIPEETLPKKKKQKMNENVVSHLTFPIAAGDTIPGNRPSMTSRPGGARESLFTALCLSRQKPFFAKQTTFTNSKLP